MSKLYPTEETYYPTEEKSLQMDNDSHHHHHHHESIQQYQQQQHQHQDQYDININTLNITSEDIDFDEIDDDLERFQEDEMVKQALQRGIDLRKYALELTLQLKEVRVI